MFEGYLLCIVGTTLLCSILTAILPEGKTNAFVKGVARLICLIAIVSPLPKFLQKEELFDFFLSDSQENTQQELGETVIQTDENFIHYVSELRVKATESMLEQQVENVFQVECAIQLACTISPTDASLLPDKIYLQFASDVEEEQVHLVVEYLRKQYLCEVLIE